MAVSGTYEVTTITVAGATITYPLTDLVQQYEVKASGGAVILVGNVDISESGTPARGDSYRLLISGGFTLGANTFTVFGATLTAAQVLYKTMVYVYYNGTTWEVYVNSDDTSGQVAILGTNIVSGTIVNAQISAGALIAWTKLAQAPANVRGHFLRSGANGVVESAIGSVAGQMLIGDGTDVISVAPSGAFTMSAAGVATIPAGYVTTAMLASPGSTLLEASLTIVAANVLLLNGTPLTIIAAPGAGKYIEIISASASMTFVSAAYATNTTLQLINSGAGTAQFNNTGALIGTVTKNTNFVPATAAAAGATQATTNTAVTVSVATGNPTAGDSILKVMVCYRIVTIP